MRRSIAAVTVAVLGAGAFIAACGSGSDADMPSATGVALPVELPARDRHVTPRLRADPAAPQIPTTPELLAQALVAGTVRVEDCEAADLATAAEHVFDDVGCEPDEAELIARLDVVRRMGRDGAGAVGRVIAAAERTEVTAIAAHAALDAIDPEKTLRVPVYLANSFNFSGAIVATDGLWDIGPTVIPTLIDVLDGRVEGCASTVAEVLDQFGPEAVAALPALRRVARGGDEADARAAAAALWHVSAGTEVVVEPLVRAMREDPALLDEFVAARPPVGAELAPLLASSDGDVRVYAALLLAEITPETDGILPVLLAERGSGSQWFFDRRTRAIDRLPPSVTQDVPKLAAMLTGTAIEAEWAATALARTGDRVNALPALRAAFTKGPRPDVLPAVAKAVVSFGSDQADLVLDTLVARLGEQREVRSSTCHGGFTRAPRVEIGVPWAAECLGDLGATAAPAVPALVRALDGTAIVGESIDALARIGAPAVGSLRAALADPSVAVRGSAAAALLRIEPSAADAASALAAALASKEHTHHWAWISGLGPGHDAMLAAVRAIERDGHPNLRVAAARAECRITGEARPLVAVIASVLATDTNQSYAAIQAIRDLGPGARDAVPALARWIEREERIDADTADLLVSLGPDAALAVPALARIVATGLDHDVKQACRALTAIGPGAADAVPALVGRLQRAHRWPENRALESLGAIGPAAASAVPEVRRWLRCYWRSTRVAAAAALAKIEGR